MLSSSSLLAARIWHPLAQLRQRPCGFSARAVFAVHRFAMLRTYLHISISYAAPCAVSFARSFLIAALLSCMILDSDKLRRRAI